jgi:hypothetical protein
MTYVVHPAGISFETNVNLYGTIYIDNTEKAVVICLIIPTIFPVDTWSSIKKIPENVTYVVHHFKIVLRHVFYKEVFALFSVDSVRHTSRYFFSRTL